MISLVIEVIFAIIISYLIAIIVAELLERRKGKGKR